MPDVISDTNGKLCEGSYHMWRLLSNPDNYSLLICTESSNDGLLHIMILLFKCHPFKLHLQ